MEKITLKVSDVISCWEPLLKLSEREIPIKVALRLGRLIRALEPERKLIEDYKMKLIQKYGETDDKTGNLGVPPQNMPKFMEEFNGFAETTTDVYLELLDDELFEEISYINMNSRDMAHLVPLTKETYEGKHSKKN